MPDSSPEPTLPPKALSMRDCDRATCQEFKGWDWGCTGKCGRTPCKRCNGTGNQLYGMFQTCDDCRGSGHDATA